MPVTVAQARDEINAVLKDAIDATENQTPDYSDLKILWDDVEGDVPTDTKVAWLRLTVKHATGGNVSLGGSDGKRRRNRAGTLAVQVFTPVGDGHSTADALVAIIMGAYEDGSTPNGVWFRNVRPNEVGKSGGWDQTNVLADFEYDEVR